MRIRSVILLLCAVPLTAAAEPVEQAQQPVRSVLSGIVRDSDGAPLAGASIVLDGTLLGTISGSDGRFSLTLPARHAESVVLIVSFLGKRTVEVTVDNLNREIAVTLVNESEEIDAVVVTGIFDKPRESYTGAATMITAEQIAQTGTGSLINRIGILDPSFYIVDNILSGSDPNMMNMRIQMRGSTSLGVGIREMQDGTRETAEDNLPLFIIDGFEVKLREVLDLDPNQVQSVTLLKDASATALYGSRGSNGIMVIVKKPPVKGKVTISYKGDMGINAPDLTSYDLLNAREKLEYEVAAGLYEGGGIENQAALDQVYSIHRAEVERGVDTYWLKYPVRVGIGHQHSLRAEGGDDNMLYAANFNVNNNVGVMKGSGRTTVGGNIRLVYTHKNFRIQDELGVSYNKAKDSPYGAFSLYTRLNPYWTPYDDEGHLKKLLSTFTSIDGFPVGNPLKDATLPSRKDSQYDEWYNNLMVTWTPFEGASIRGRLKVARNTSRRDDFLSSEHSSFAYYQSDLYMNRGRYTYSSTVDARWEGGVTANYNKTFRDLHQLYLGFDFNFAQEKLDTNAVVGQGYAPSESIQLGLAHSYPEGSSPVSYDSFTRRAGFTLNANYTYDERYYADVSAKIDGSSKFGSNKRMAPFWSVGVGWNLHRERFIEQPDWITRMRLRLSYGTSGAQNFSPFQARTTFRNYNDAYYQNLWTGSYMIALGNPDLEWQMTGELNAGFEMEMFRGRWMINADFYNKRTRGILIDVDIPPAAGFNSYKTNMGEVENKGFEIMTSVFLVRDTENMIMWSLSGSVVHNKNRVLKISDGVETLNNALLLSGENFSTPSYLIREGESTNTLYAVPSLGIDPSTGQEIFLDRFGERTFIWDPRDEVACGVEDPKLRGNFGTMFRWHGLSLNVAFTFRTGGYIYNSTLVKRVENVNPGLNVDRRVWTDRWKEPGDKSKFKGIREYNSNTNASTRFVMQEHALDCRLVSLTYEPDREWVSNRLGLDYLSLGLSTESLFRISTIKQERGTDYPFARTFALSATVRF